MFGHADENQDQAQIPTQSIDGVLQDDQSMPQPTAPAPAWQHPGLPLSDDTTTSPVGEPSADPVSTFVPVAASSNPAVAPDELLNIKQQALDQLTPLVSHLDLSPEERFHTTMMMIRSNDNHDLIKDAYAAAQAIPDEKTRAEALLDVVNEINYFTQPPHQPAAE